MTIISKAALAAELGITKPRVSQYVKEGLPVRQDGRLDREDALNWISSRYPASGRERQAGVNRAAELARAVKPKRSRQPRAATQDENPVDAAMINALAEVLSDVVPAMADLAIDLGLPCRMAYAFQIHAFDTITHKADSFLQRCGLEAFGHGGTATLSAFAKNTGTDWPALAARAGEKVDLEAWDDFANECFGHEAAHV